MGPSPIPFQLNTDESVASTIEDESETKGDSACMISSSTLTDRSPTVSSSGSAFRSYSRSESSNSGRTSVNHDHEDSPRNLVGFRHPSFCSDSTTPESSPDTRYKMLKYNGRRSSSPINSILPKVKILESEEGIEEKSLKAEMNSRSEKSHVRRLSVSIPRSDSFPRLIRANSAPTKRYCIVYYFYY